MLGRVAAGSAGDRRTRVVRRQEERWAAALRASHAQLDYWGWQTCTEFGFYQTCEVGSRCFFTQGLNLLPDDDGFCAADYGISSGAIPAACS